jgi:hypothetical protein
MTRKSLITLILGTALAVAPAAHAQVLSECGTTNASSTVTQGTGLSPAEYQALLIRGEALNQLYRSSQASTTGLSKAEYRALKIRGEALNEKYGVSSTTAQPEVTDGWANSITTSYSFRPDILGGNGGVSAQPTATGDDSFEWGTVGAGAATLIGVMLLGLASLAVTRRRHQPSF